MNPKLKSTLDSLADQARVNLEMHGHLLPVAFLMTNTAMQIIGCPWQNDDDKERAIVVIREKAREMNANLCVMLAEAWHAKLPPDGKWDGTPAREMPNKEEVVQMYVEAADDGYWLGLAPITRDTGAPTFGKLTFQPMLVERAACERFQKILA